MVDVVLKIYIVVKTCYQYKFDKYPIINCKYPIHSILRI